MSDTDQSIRAQASEPVALEDGAGHASRFCGPGASDGHDRLQRVRALRELVAYLEAKNRLPSHEAVLLLRLTCVVPPLVSCESGLPTGEAATC